MSQKLNTNQIEELENFIIGEETNGYRSRSPCISPKDIKTQYEYFIEITNAPIHSYYIFGCSGMTSYSYYKSKNNKIYIISSYMNDICGCVEVSNI
jgi:hypothetical protein